MYQPVSGSSHDRAIYGSAAEAATNGTFLPDGALEYLPLYPWLLGMLGMLFGTGPVTAAVFGMLCDALTTGLIVCFARRLGARSWIAATAGLLYAAYPLAAVYSLLAMPNTLNTWGVTIFTYLTYRLFEEKESAPPLWAAFLLGLFAGVLTLGFAGMMLIVAAIAVFVCLKTKAVWTAALLIIGTAIPIAPVAMHNSDAEGSFVLLTTHGGLNFYMGNHQEATGYPLRIANFRMTAKHMLEDAHHHAEQATGQTMTRAESSAWWSEQAHGFWKSDTTHALLLTAKKIARFWNHRDMDDLRLLEQLRVTEPFFRHAAGTPFALFGILGLVGIFFSAYGRVPRMVLLTGMIGIVMFFITARYRLTFVPLMAITGAGGVTQLIDSWKQGHKKRALLVIPIVLFVLIPFTVRDQRPVDYHNAAIQLINEQRFDEALELVNRGLAIDPNMGTLYSAQGSIYYKQKKFIRAAQSYRNAQALNPGNASTAYNLALSLAQAGDYCAARDALAGLQSDEKIAPLFHELDAACNN